MYLFWCISVSMDARNSNSISPIMEVTRIVWRLNSKFEGEAFCKRWVIIPDNPVWFFGPFLAQKWAHRLSKIILSPVGSKGFLSSSPSLGTLEIIFSWLNNLTNSQASIRSEKSMKHKNNFIILIVKNLTFLMPNLFLSDRWRHPRE